MRAAIKEYQNSIQKEILYIEYKKKILTYILNHDAIKNGEPTTLPIIEDNYYKEKYKTGQDINSILKDIDEEFNRYGW